MSQCHIHKGGKGDFVFNGKLNTKLRLHDFQSHWMASHHYTICWLVTESLAVILSSNYSKRLVTGGYTIHDPSPGVNVYLVFMVTQERPVTPKANFKMGSKRDQTLHYIAPREISETRRSFTCFAGIGKEMENDSKEEFQNRYRSWSIKQGLEPYNPRYKYKSL